MKMRRRAQSGFTFIEIIVVVLILATLAGLVIPKFVGRAEDAKRTKTVLQMKEIMKALEMYRLDNGFYPSTEQGLAALESRPTGDPEPKKWKQYLEKIPQDAWKKDFIYVCPGQDHSKNPNMEDSENEQLYIRFDLTSLGRDGVESDDDLKSWDLPED